MPTQHDLPTLLWQHTVLLHAAARSDHVAEWEHYIGKAARLGEVIAEHVIGEEEDVGADQVDQAGVLG